MADWDMMFTFVDDIQTILTDNLEVNLVIEETAHPEYPLPMGPVLDYEINVPEKDPTFIILPETNDVTGQEAGSEILTGNVMVWLILRGTQRKYPRRIFLYEKAIRKTIFENRDQGEDRFYRATAATYGLERTMGSRVIKDAMFTIVPRGQFSYV